MEVSRPSWAGSRHRERGAMKLNDYVSNGCVAGGIIMVCPACGKEHIRNAVHVLEMEHPEYCIWCGTVELCPLLKKERIENNYG